MPSPDSAVGLMARYPELGKVKTRLAAEVGDGRALSVYRSLLENVCDRCAPKSEADYLWTCWVTPGSRLEHFRAAFSGFHRYAVQADGELGVRMAAALTELLEQSGIRKAVLIGADIPDLDRARIIQALEVLEDVDVVWGPTGDGGYYLIGMRAVHPSLFEGIDWGGPDVLERSMAAAKQNGLSYRLLESLDDIDTADDLGNAGRFSNRRKT
jgi:rSAM/selenodomain-associated transferase 1